MKNDTDLLEYFLANEKKQKKVTAITAVLFSLFAMVIIVLAVVAYKQKVAIETKNKNIFSLNDSLVNVSLRLDSLNQLLNSKNTRLSQEKITLNRTAVIYEQKNMEINRELEKIASSDSVPTASNPKGNNTKTIVQSKAIKDLLLKTNKTKYTIYIQYTPSKISEAEQVRVSFLNAKFNVPKLQNMKNLMFKSSIRYFYKEDEEQAKEIAKIIEETTGQEYVLQLLKLKSPKNQLEVWVGN